MFVNNNFKASTEIFERKFESLKERLLKRTYLTRIVFRESFLKESVVGYVKFGTKPRLVKLSFVL